MPETFFEREARMKQGGCADPRAMPKIQERGPGDYEALWHHAQCLRVWGELGWLRATELEAHLDEQIERATIKPRLPDPNSCELPNWGADAGFSRTATPDVEI